MIRITANAEGAKAMLRRLKEALQQPEINEILEKQAWRAMGRLVSNTPKRFTGQTRASWSVKKTDRGFRVGNPSKVMMFLEEGTRAHGAANGGFLYIPLTANAMIWRRGLIFGRDFRLARHVKGITARHIVRDEAAVSREETKIALVENIKKYVRG